jgi:SPP1 gp7 family putative phage head morphogenesis protein
MNERQAYLAIRNAIRLENLSDDMAKKVAPQLRAIFNELGNQFRRVPAGNIEREMWYRQQRLRIADMLAPLSIEMRNELTQRLGLEVAQQMHYAESYLRIAGEDPANLVAAAAPQDGVSLGFDPANAVAGRPQFTRTQLHAITQETRVLGDRLEELFEPQIGKGDMGPWIRQNVNVIDRVVKAGFLTGQTNEQIAEALSGATRESISRTRAIARTATMSLSANAQEAFWQANSDVVKGWEFDASMDNRVCPQCAPWDGESRPERSKLPATPLHVNCRCRVLPLTATEMLLREEEGPQRRSVIELIEAPSKEAAIAKAKLKPGATEARAYASQVRVKGKKYWRVAVDIKKPDGPLTMGEFLKQASPITQSEVLGSNKRRGIFMRKITGDKNHPPMSPERALKETVEWKPTVSRRPRMDAQLRLDIERLKSQKEEMKKATEGDQFGVYAYLREKDSAHGKAGSPYYIGKMADAKRPWGPHTTPVPPDPRRVRLLRGGLTEQKANEWEKFYIKKFGRIDLGTGGLRNLTDGGEGKANPSAEARAKIGAFHKGKAKSAQTRAKMSAAQAGKIRSAETRAKIGAISGSRSAETIAKLKAASTGKTHSAETRAKLSAVQTAKMRAVAAKYGIDPDIYLAFTPAERKLITRRYTQGKRGAELLENLDSSRIGKQQAVAARYGIDLGEYLALTDAARNVMRVRYSRGKRGAALLEGLI